MATARDARQTPDPRGAAVADPARFTVPREPARGERPAREPAELTGAQVTAVCQDLARLRTAGLVGSRREATRICRRAAGACVRARPGGAFLVAGALAGAAFPGHHGSVRPGPGA